MTLILLGQDHKYGESQNERNCGSRTKKKAKIPPKWLDVCGPKAPIKQEMAPNQTPSMLLAAAAVFFAVFQVFLEFSSSVPLLA